jgi:hypothetical protein
LGKFEKVMASFVTNIQSSKLQYFLMIPRNELPTPETSPNQAQAHHKIYHHTKCK